MPELSPQQVISPPLILLPVLKYVLLIIYFALADYCHLPFGKINRFHLVFIMKKQNLKICNVDIILMITKSKILLASAKSSVVFFLFEWLEYKAIIIAKIPRLSTRIHPLSLSFLVSVSFPCSLPSHLISSLSSFSLPLMLGLWVNRNKNNTLQDINCTQLDKPKITVTEEGQI